MITTDGYREKSSDTIIFMCITEKVTAIGRVTAIGYRPAIDRFQVSHFRPVVMEIEIGGQSEKSLGGQESAAVDQECMGSNASSCNFALSFPIRLPFFFAGTCLMLGAANSSSP